MAALGDVVGRFHGLLEQNGFREAGWAEDLQQHMRQRRLTDSGRLLSPVLRPSFITPKQVDLLARTANQFSSLFDRLAPMILANPAWLNRLQMLPAEKSLLRTDPAHESFSLAGSLDVHLQGSDLAVSNVSACCPSGLAQAGALADVFWDTRVLKAFRHSGQPVALLPGLQRLAAPIAAAWKQFGGKTRPAVAVVDWLNTGSDAASEGELLASLLTAQGMEARFTPPEKLSFSEGALHDPAGRIDVVVRRIPARDLLTRWDLSHPLLEAYRARAVCMVNSFRSEIGQRRVFLELLTDESIAAHLPAADRKLLKQVVWTRLLSPRKVRYNGQEVDLMDFTLKNREKLSLAPNLPSPELRTYPGSEMTGAAWEWAVKQALRTPYVVQESAANPPESFPFFQYGEFKLRPVNVTIQAQMLGGKLGNCMALLCNRASGGVTPLGIAPVLMAG